MDTFAEGGELGEDELAELALSCDPDQPLDPGAVPLELEGTRSFALLPSWYMPPAVSIGSSRWRKGAVLLIVATLLTIEALGLCSVFGQVVVG